MKYFLQRKFIFSLHCLNYFLFVLEVLKQYWWTEFLQNTWNTIMKHNLAWTVYFFSILYYNINIYVNQEKIREAEKKCTMKYNKYMYISTYHSNFMKKKDDTGTRLNTFFVRCLQFCKILYQVNIGNLCFFSLKLFLCGQWCFQKTKRFVDCCVMRACTLCKILATVSWNMLATHNK